MVNIGNTFTEDMWSISIRDLYCSSLNHFTNWRDWSWHGHRYFWRYITFPSPFCHYCISSFPTCMSKNRWTRCLLQRSWRLERHH